MRKKLYKAISFFLAILMLLSLSGCITGTTILDGTDSPSATDTSVANREEAFRSVVQRLVNTFGIVTPDKLAPFKEGRYDDTSLATFREVVSGVMEAKMIDVTGDGKDELFCVWYNNGIKAAVFEYENGSANLAWTDRIGDVCNIFHFSLYKIQNQILWNWGNTRHYFDSFISYIDKQYQNALKDGFIFTAEEQQYIDEEAAHGKINESDAIKKVCEKRLGIDGDEDERVLDIRIEGYDLTLTPDDFASRWNITIPEPKFSPQQLLAKLPYLGDRSACKMDKAMAEAFANTIESVRSKYQTNGNYTLYAYLADPADDGFPVLITAFCREDLYNFYVAHDENEQPMFDVWTYHEGTVQNVAVETHNQIGQKADSIQFLSDNGKPIIGLRYSVYRGTDDGTQGIVYYAIENGQMTMLHDEMECAARGYGSDTMYGYYIPLKDGTIYGDKVGNNPGLPAQTLIENGWYVSGHGTPGVSAVAYAMVLDGKLIPASNNPNDAIWANMFSQNLRDSSYGQIMEGSIDLYITNWSKADEVTDLLRSYAKVAARPSYAYDRVSALLTNAQYNALADAVSKLFTGEIDEIYKLADDLYYVIVFANDTPCGGVLIKNTENGTGWRVIHSSETLMTADALQTVADDDQSKSNITIDYTKTDKSTAYLQSVLENIDGSVPNNAAKSELVGYIETCISKDSQIDVKAKKNCIAVTDKTIEKSVEKAIKTRDTLTQLLREKDVSTNKRASVILHILCKKTNVEEPVQITFDKSLIGAYGEADAIKILLEDAEHSVLISADTLQKLLEKYGQFSVILQKTEKNTYTIQFADADGNRIDKIESSLLFELPAMHELCTVEAEYVGGADNWGGQYDENRHTISFETPFTGNYTILEDTENISDIDTLTEEQQKAIRFMVSKGYFTLDNAQFSPDSTLTRYDFSQALVRMFFALDKSLVCPFPDVTTDNPYYPFVASGAAIRVIEGYDDGTFKGDKNVLREEVLSLCSRTLKERKGYIEPAQPSDFLHFTDAAAIPNWARGEIALAVREGLIKSGNALEPGAEISRAESAEILYRLFMLLYEVEPVPVNTSASSSALPIVIGSTVGIAALSACILFIGRKRRKSKNTEQ